MGLSIRFFSILLASVLLRPLPTAAAAELKPNDIVGIAVAWDTGHVYAWYRDGTVSSGTSNDLSRHRTRYPYVLPDGYRPRQIVGIAHLPFFQADGNTPLYNLKPVPATYVFYRDGKFSIGVSNNLAKFAQPRPYRLPDGKRPRDIVGVSYSKKKEMTYQAMRSHKDMAFFAFYKDGTVSAGFEANELDTFRKPYKFVPPAGIDPGDIVGMGCPANTRHHYGWYRDGTVSSGASDHLDRHRKRYSYKVP